MDSAFEAREKWNIDKALEDVMHAVDVYRSELHGYETRVSWKNLVGYIGVLELDLKNAQEKLNELRIQSK